MTTLEKIKAEIKRLQDQHCASPEVALDTIYTFIESLEEQNTKLSEEDEEMISSIEQWLHEEKPEYVEKELAWLENLRKRILWKPSDNQMGALWNAIANCEDKYDYTDLSSLMNDLEKL